MQIKSALAAAALCATAATAQAQTQNHLIFANGLGAVETIDGQLYPQAAISTSNPFITPFANGNINFTTGSLPGIAENAAEFRFIPSGFWKVDGNTQPYCQFQLNLQPLLNTGRRNLQALAGGVQPVFATSFGQLETGDWYVDVQFTYEADFAVTGTASQAAWRLNFLCWPK
jgi:hypothetical protein